LEITFASYIKDVNQLNNFSSRDISGFKDDIKMSDTDNNRKFEEVFEEKAGFQETGKEKIEKPEEKKGFEKSQKSENKNKTETVENEKTAKNPEASESNKVSGDKISEKSKKENVCGKVINKNIKENKEKGDEKECLKKEETPDSFHVLLNADSTVRSSAKGKTNTKEDRMDGDLPGSGDSGIKNTKHQGFWIEGKANKKILKGTDRKEEKKKSVVQVVDSRKERIKSHRKISGIQGTQKPEGLTNEEAKLHYFSDGAKGSVKNTDNINQGGRSALSAQDASSLTKELRETLNKDIVKNAEVILKDNNKGELRLILKPERLGKVRIRINLSDNRLGGKIFVENGMVRSIFENNLDSLNKAFKEVGYEVGELSVSVQGDSREKRESNNKENQSDRKGLRLDSAGRQGYLIPSIDEIFFRDQLVDLVV